MKKVTHAFLKNSDCLCVYVHVFVHFMCMCLCVCTCICIHSSDDTSNRERGLDEAGMNGFVYQHLCLCVHASVCSLVCIQHLCLCVHANVCIHICFLVSACSLCAHVCVQRDERCSWRCGSADCMSVLCFLQRSSTGQIISCSTLQAIAVQHVQQPTLKSKEERNRRKVRGGA